MNANKPKAVLTAALDAFDTRSMSFDLREIVNYGRFTFSPQAGDDFRRRYRRGWQLYRSHAAEFSLDSWAKASTDSFIRGWLSAISRDYLAGVILNAPNIGTGEDMRLDS